MKKEEKEENRKNERECAMNRKTKAAYPLPFESDMAKERCPKEGASQGVFHTENKEEYYTLTEVRVTRPKAAERLGRPMGEYATLQFASVPLLTRQAQGEIESGVAALLRKLVPSTVRRLLVVGLGNRRMTVDSIGPRVAEGVTATAVLSGALTAESLSPPTHLISVFCPDVYGETGMETTALVKAAVSLTRAQAILAIDAMATATPSHLLRAIEVTDTGTAPGAGIGNRRLPLSRETVGVPVIAIGIPTMMRARPRLRRALVDFGVEAGHADSYAKREEGLLLIPSALEEGVATLSRLTSRAINASFGIGVE